MEWYKEEIGKCTYREFTTGFYFGKPTTDSQIYDSNTYVKNYTYLGTVEEVREDGCCRIEQKNKFFVGEQIEIMKPDGRNVLVTVKGITDEGWKRHGERAASEADLVGRPWKRSQPVRYSEKK